MRSPWRWQCRVKSHRPRDWSGKMCILQSPCDCFTRCYIATVPVGMEVANSSTNTVLLFNQFPPLWQPASSRNHCQPFREYTFFPPGSSNMATLEPHLHVSLPSIWQTLVQHAVLSAHPSTLFINKLVKSYITCCTPSFLLKAWTICNTSTFVQLPKLKMTSR